MNRTVVLLTSCVLQKLQKHPGVHISFLRIKRETNLFLNTANQLILKLWIRINNRIVFMWRQTIRGLYISLHFFRFDLMNYPDC